MADYLHHPKHSTLGGGATLLAACVRDCSQRPWEQGCSMLSYSPNEVTQKTPSDIPVAAPIYEQNLQNIKGHYELH